MSRELIRPQDQPAGRRLKRRQRDFLLLNIFVLLQHGYIERASLLADAMFFSGEEDGEVQLARAILRFGRGHWRETLEVLEILDRIDPIERFGTYRLSTRQLMRRYLKTRCYFELGETTRMRDALDAYVRHTVPTPEEPE